MKIYNINLFEKLKIRPVNVGKLMMLSEEDPYKMTINDLKPGYFARTMERRDNLYMFVHKETIMQFGEDSLNSYLDDYLVLIQPYENIYEFTTLSLFSYKDNFPMYDTYDTDELKYDIKKIYITDLDTSKIHTIKDFKLYFEKYESIINKL